jgi:myo-inositol-1(or 4)-monophosphatase
MGSWPLVPAEATARALEADWLGAFGRATDRIEQMLERHPSTPEREIGTGRGAGGDNTLVIDGRAEDLIFAELDALHEEGASFTAISEERGTVVFGDGESAVRVVIDPIDGSLNA